jgi:hypothetical protein
MQVETVDLEMSRSCFTRVHSSTPVIPKPHLRFSQSISVLTSRLLLGLPVGRLLKGFPTKILYVYLVSLILATCQTHHRRLDVIIKTSTNHRVPPNSVNWNWICDVILFLVNRSRIVVVNLLWLLSLSQNWALIKLPPSLLFISLHSKTCRN